MDFFLFLGREWPLVSLLAGLVYAYAWVERERSGRPISCLKATLLLNRGRAVLVDLRPAKEYHAGHIAGAIHLPHDQFDGRMGELEKHRDKVIILADRLGQHAGRAGRRLRASGYQVRRLAGGIAEWTAQGLPLVKK